MLHIFVFKVKVLISTVALTCVHTPRNNGDLFTFDDDKTLQSGQIFIINFIVQNWRLKTSKPTLTITTGINL